MLPWDENIRWQTLLAVEYKKHYIHMIADIDDYKWWREDSRVVLVDSACYIKMTSFNIFMFDVLFSL